ncbi:RNA polymerase sigma factor for flagellar operon [Gossypium australe]|uniref:RNA polymerase sigma factor for flagellar operon n=1 Tax=Gossypium australe TaxID=47621 RepID=A0A5B6VR71_9ROSI|nr:RNA polymerase sigma factor for flagellar operon [Gossypium australe]
MKVAKEWRLGSMGDTKILPGSRHRSPSKRPIWIILMVSFVSLFLVCAYIYPPNSDVACYVFSSRGCKVFTDWLPPPKRELTDEEIISRVVVRDILDTPPVELKNPKIAFMFLTPGSLPFEKLWDMFFRGNEGRFSVYIHASKEKPVHVSPYFLNREIHSSPVTWGAFSMVDAERRLLAYALKDPDNQHFVLLSDSFVDPGPHGNGRYSTRMLPEIEEKDFRKGAQPFADGKNCIADEHYLPTFFNLVDPGGIANWSVTRVDWSERKWHPKSYRAQDVTYDLLRNFTGEELLQPCIWNGTRRPCYLFARKFYPETLDKLVTLLNF